MEIALALAVPACYSRAMSLRPSGRGVRRRRLLDGGRQPAARRLRAPSRRRAPEGLLHAHRVGRRRPLHRALLPRGPGARCEPSHVSLFRRDKRRRPGRRVAEPPARAGPDLRRRRQRRVAARRVARARPRRRPARGWARGRAVRAERRLAVLVRRGGHPSTARREPCEGLGLLPWSNCVHYDGEPRAPRAYHAAVAAGMAPGYAADDGAALHFVGHRPGARRRLAAGARRLPGRVREGAAMETPLEPVPGARRACSLAA